MAVTRAGLLLVVACADPGQSPQKVLVETFTDRGPSVQVATNDYVIDFSESGIPLPKSMRIGNRELFAPPDECNTEGALGVAMFPAVSVIANAPPASTASTIDIASFGPVVSQVVVVWDVDYTCTDPQTISGTSTFTFFPAGRIVRHDKAIVPVTSTINAPTSNCNCADGGATVPDFFVTSFWAFDPTGAQNVDATGAPTTGGQSGACSIYADRGIAVNWSDNTTRVGVNGVASHVLDLVPQNSTTVTSTPVEAFSGVQIISQDPGGPSACGEMLELLANPLIDVGGATPFRTDDDGIYRDGDTFHDTPFDITAPEGSLPAGFAVSLNLDGADHAEITRDPPVDGDLVFVQRDFKDRDRFLFVFPDGLGGGERITISPQ